MKILLTTLLAGAAFLCCATTASAQYTPPPDSCLKLYWDQRAYENGGFLGNPDSLKIDSCSDHPIYKPWYAKHWFVLSFAYNIIPRNYTAPEDTVIEYNWQDILEIYPDAREAFEELEDKYGQFYFREDAPNARDTSIYAPQRSLSIRFENYVPSDSVATYISNFPFITQQVAFQSGLQYITSVGDNTNNNAPLLHPNPASESITIASDLVLPDTEMRIISADGRVMKTLTYDGAPINVRDLPSGVYMLRAGRQGQMFTVVR